jgi:5,10-methylenetetrahydromethanopterin reductase
VLRFDVALYPTRHAAEQVRLGVLAESLGFERVWVPDSPAIWRELWVTLGALAVRTERVRLGSAVTTGLTRHPAVTVSASSSVAELSGGRFDLGLGNGDSSAVTTGGRAQSLADFRQTTEAVRRLLAGERVSVRGAPLEIGWVAGPHASPSTSQRVGRGCWSWPGGSPTA